MVNTTTNNSDCVVHINVDDVETKLYSEPPICRICLQEETDDKQLIYPCNCTGTANFVHMECLNEWRNTSPNPLAATKCLICNTSYRLLKIEKHLFYNWCIFINYNTTLIFIYQQISALILTIFISANTPQTHNQLKKNNTIYQHYQTLADLYTINVVSSVFIMLLYTLYVFIRYTRRRKKLCCKIIENVLTNGVSCLFFICFMYIIIPEFTIFTALACVWIIDDLVLKTFKSIEIDNRRYSRQVILNRV